MLDLIEEIEKATEAGFLKVALGMALTLPDICGQIEYPDINRVGDRYAKWCDKFLHNQGFTTVGNEDGKIISGDMCYKLRCSYLHSGNTELNQRKRDDYPDFILILCNKENQGVYCEPRHFNAEGKEVLITLDVYHLIEILCRVTKEYYDSHDNKNVFINHGVVFDNVDEKSKEVEEAKGIAHSILTSKKDVTDPDELSPNAIFYGKLLKDEPDEYKHAFDSPNRDERINVMAAIEELIAGGFLILNK